MFLSIGSPEILLFSRDKPAIATRMKRRLSKMCWINRLDHRTLSKNRCPTVLHATRARVKRWQRSWSANANDTVSGTGNWRVWERSKMHEIHRLRRCYSRRMCRWSSRSVSSKTKPTNCDRTISSSTKRSNSCKPIQWGPLALSITYLIWDCFVDDKKTGWIGWSLFSWLREFHWSIHEFHQTGWRLRIRN